MSELTFQRETVTPAMIAGELVTLAAEHVAECCPFDDLPAAVDVACYMALQDAGLLRGYSARRADGTLVGYASYVVRRHPHHLTLLWGGHDLLYLSPDERQGMTGVRLLRFAEGELAAEGVGVVTMTGGRKKNIGPLLERLGYRPIETVYAKRLPPAPPEVSEASEAPVVAEAGRSE